VAAVVARGARPAVAGVMAAMVVDALVGAVADVADGIVGAVTSLRAGGQRERGDGGDGEQCLDES
jgi:hypothetical protein